MALEYLIHVDSLLFRAAQALLNVNPAATTFNNLFASPKLKALGDVNQNSGRKPATIFIKTLIGVGLLVYIIFPFLFAYTRWDSLCMDYQAGFMSVADLTKITNPENREQACFEQQLAAQRCQAVFDKFVFTTPHLESSVESCGVPNYM